MVAPGVPDKGGRVLVPLVEFDASEDAIVSELL